MAKPSVDNEPSDAAMRRPPLAEQGEPPAANPDPLNLVERLIARLVHELINPVFSVRSGLGVLQQLGSMSGEQEDVVASALADIERLQARLVTLRARLRILPLRIELSSLGQVLDDVVAKVAPMASAAGVGLEAEPAPAIMLPIDGRAIVLALAEVVRNAVEAAGAGGRVWIRCATLSEPDVAARFPGARGEAVSITVIDSGIGPPENLRSRMFTPLVTSKDRSLGLGLAIARQVVDIHGGQLTLASTEPTTMELVLPAGDRRACWAAADARRRCGDGCSRCEVYLRDQAYACWVVGGLKERQESGIWPRGCRSCEVFAACRLPSGSGSW